MPRIALIHALQHSVAPINEALARDWPQATRMNLIDDSLSADLARSGQLDAAMHARFATLTDYAVACGAQGILFTCSAFGPCISAAALRHPGLPVFKPNQAMVADAEAAAHSSGGGGGSGGGGAKIGLIASFAPTLQSMPAEFSPDTALALEFADGAMAALDRGDMAGHDAAVLRAGQRLQARGCTLMALAQFSMARAAPGLRQTLGLPVLTTIDSAVAALRLRLAASP